MTPSQVIDELKKGNERFRTGKMAPRDYLAEKRSSAAGQYPAAVVLGCLDSRVPAEIVFDAGIGDIFTGRVAGNVVNDDMLGSMEFGCAVSGAKLVLVLGHTACGAVKGAIDDVVLGNLTGLLARIKPAIPETKFDGEKSSKNASYVDAVARTNVVLASPRFAGAVQSWRNWKRKEVSRSVARCTIWQLEWWSLSANSGFRLDPDGASQAMNLLNFPFLVFALSFVVLWLSVQTGDTLRNRLRPLQEDERLISVSCSVQS